MTSNVQEPAVARKRGLAELYVPKAGAHDEMLGPDGSLSPQWQLLVSAMDDLGNKEVASRWDQARRIIRENGITHNIYGDPNGLSRPWNLDLLPLVLPNPEWQTVASGLAQRARLLDALLADL